MNSTTATATTLNPRFLERSVSWNRALILIAVVLGAIANYLSRYWIGVDGISYLDVALAYARHDWSIAINGYWSPLYCWVLAIFLSLPHSASTEYPIMHLANFLCYLFALYGFHKFWTELKSYLREQSTTEMSGLAEFAPVLWDIFGYFLFLYLFLQIVSSGADVLASGFIFLSSQRALKWQKEAEHSVSEIVGFAVTLAFGYLAKAILLYFGLFLLAALLMRAHRQRMRSLLLVGCLFALMVLPWALALRSTFGEFTPGYSGKLAYSWFMNGTEAGEFLESTGLPYFPGPQISSNPTAYAVHVVPHVTYWPWYDPARVEKSQSPRFHVSRQLSIIRKNMVWLRSWFLIEFGALTLSVLALWIRGGNLAVGRVLREWVLWAPILMVIGMYGLVFIRSFRYIAAFTIILFGLALGSARLPRPELRIARALVVAALSIFIFLNVPGALKAIIQGAGKGKEHVTVALGLTASGIRSGDSVGVIQSEITGADYFYWAPLARVSVGAEIRPVDSGDFWRAKKDQQAQLVCAMERDAGVKTIVGHPPAGVHLDAGEWAELGDTGYFRFSGLANGCL